MAVAAALLAGVVVFAVTFLVSIDGNVHFTSTGLATGLVVAVLTLIGLRALLLPQLSRIEDVVVRIQTMVTGGEVDGTRGKAESGRDAGDARHSEVTVAARKPVRDDEEIDLVARLESTAEKVAAKLQELRKIENYRQEFIGDVSHEMQTPIFAIQGFAETLLDGALDDGEVNRAFVEKIVRHSERLSTLVNDLSHISQIESGSLKMKLEPFDPRTLVKETDESLEQAASADQISLYRFVSPEVRYVLGDRMRIRQVLDNLVINGIKYNEPGGRVEVAVRPGRNGRVLFSVTDDGIGIGPEHINRVTERFYRIDKSRSRERGGTGLGLAIVKHILEAHGSSLHVNSQPGRGSTFSFELDSASKPNKPDGR